MRSTEGRGRGSPLGRGTFGRGAQGRGPMRAIKSRAFDSRVLRRRERGRWWWWGGGRRGACLDGALGGEERHAEALADHVRREEEVLGPVGARGRAQGSAGANEGRAARRAHGPGRVEGRRRWGRRGGGGGERGPDTAHADPHANGALAGGERARGRATVGLGHRRSFSPPRVTSTKALAGSRRTSPTAMPSRVTIRTAASGGRSSSGPPPPPPPLSLPAGAGARRRRASSAASKTAGMELVAGLMWSETHGGPAILSHILSAIDSGRM